MAWPRTIRGSAIRTLRTWAAALLPPPRRGLLASAWWPLALLVALLAGLGLAILTHRLRLSEPWQLLWLAALPWVWWLHAAGWGGMGRWRSSVAVAVRMLLILAAVLALAGLRAVRASDQLALIYVLDCSDSIGDRLRDQAVDWITRTASGKPAHDAAGLVVFGRDSAVEIPPRQGFIYDSISSRLARDGTDIENALELAGASLPEEGPGRLVLISDGTATQGDIGRAVDQLAARHVPVDVLALEDEHSEEVWLERLELPQEVHARQSYEAGIVLGSLAPGHGSLVLTENGREIARQGVTYGEGESRFTVPLTMRAAGYYQYTATIEPKPGHDTWTQNNTVLGSITLRGKGHATVVYADGADPRERMPLVLALRGSGRQIEETPASMLPEDPQALIDTEAVVLVDVPAEAMTESQQLALRDAVQDLGTGLLMVGGEGSFGPGGWNRTPVEEALPVTMDANERKVMPKGGLAIILEMCEFENGDGWAKTITKKAIQVLSRRDDVGVLTFDWGREGGDQWIVPMQPVGDYSSMAQKIDAANLGDMPSFESIMTLALQGLLQDDASAKYLLLISDGDCAPPSVELLKRYAKEGIPVSTVLIASTDQDSQDLMRGIAKSTGGRYYFPSSPTQLPAIFIKEAKTSPPQRAAECRVHARGGLPLADPQGSRLSAAAAMATPCGCTPKPHAQVVLRGPDTETEDPVLAVWRYGTGAAAAWTSDLSGNWAAAWVSWDRYRAFVDQLVGAISRAEAPSSISVTVQEQDGQGVIEIEDHAAGTDFLSVQARVSSPGGEASDAIVLPVPQIAPGRYRYASFPLVGVGRYLGRRQRRVVGGEAGERKEHVLSTMMVSYSDEYRRFRANPQVLQEAARRTHGRVLQGGITGAELFSADRAPVYRSRPVADWAMAAAALLLPLDIAIRRVSIDLPALWAGLAFWRRRRQAASSSTMGALLGRKATIAHPAGEGLPVLRSRAQLTPRPGACRRPRPSTPGASRPSRRRLPPPRRPRAIAGAPRRCPPAPPAACSRRGASASRSAREVASAHHAGVRGSAPCPALLHALPPPVPSSPPRISAMSDIRRT